MGTKLTDAELKQMLQLITRGSYLDQHNLYAALEELLERRSRDLSEIKLGQIRERLGWATLQPDSGYPGPLKPITQEDMMRAISFASMLAMEYDYDLTDQVARMGQAMRLMSKVWDWYGHDVARLLAALSPEEKKDVS